jgi:hypothetical protein
VDDGQTERTLYLILEAVRTGTLNRQLALEQLLGIAKDANALGLANLLDAALDEALNIVRQGARRMPS